jgi:hypothetical protein
VKRLKKVFKIKRVAIRECRSGNSQEIISATLPPKAKGEVPNHTLNHQNIIVFEV